MALADAEELHQKIERLRNRSAALEDALRALQAAVSDDPHPLLQSDSDSPSSAMTVDQSSSGSSPATGPGLSSEEERILDAFGNIFARLHASQSAEDILSRYSYLRPTRRVKILRSNIPVGGMFVFRLHFSFFWSKITFLLVFTTRKSFKLSDPTMFDSGIRLRSGTVLRDVLNVLICRRNSLKKPLWTWRHDAQTLT